MRSNKKYLAIVFSLFLWTAPNAGADIFTGDRDGAYVGVDLGLSIMQDLKVRGSDNDVPTRCDQILRGVEGADDSQFMNLSAATLASREDCKRGQDSWTTDADMGTGIIVGAQAGYIFGNVRVEAEYAYRDHNSDKRRNDATIDVKAAELVDNSQSVTNFSSHSLFANVYYDFTNKSLITPYIGFGGGWSIVSMIYDASFARNPDAVALPDATPDIAAGTTTRTEDKLTDNVFGWQIMAGSDYEIDKNWSIGLKLRYARFAKIEDSNNWDYLRSHESAIAADEYTKDESLTTQEIRESDPTLENFDPTVTYRVKTGNPSFWSAALNLKYRFGGESGGQ